MMNWKCKEFKITKYNNREDYLNNKISSIETHHGNAVTNNGLLAMWTLATDGVPQTISTTSGEKTVKKFKADASGNGSVIAIGTNNPPVAVTGADEKLAMQLGNSIAVDNITITGGTGIASIKFHAESGSGENVGDWNEWGIYDVKDGILFNRKIEAMGTKSTTSVWVVEVTIELQQQSV